MVPECEGLIKEVVGGSGRVGLIEEQVEGQTVFTFSRNCLTLGGQSFESQPADTHASEYGK